LKTILLVDDWARKKAMQIISEKKFKWKKY
jgi:hypothetical protein